MGHAFHAGVLHALQVALGWDPARAELIVGTSAGAQVGALLRAGMSTCDLIARVTAQPLSPQGQAIARHYIRPPKRVPHPHYAKTYLPAAPGYLLRALLRPWALRPARLVAALLPPGRVCLQNQAEGFRKLFGAHWPKRRLWIPALHLDSGRRVVFGRPDAPAVDVGTAVTCSGAVPGICRPIHVEGHRYVDGGLISGSNLTAVRHEHLDLIVAISPLSALPIMRLLFRREVALLRRQGKAVVTIEPTPEVKRLMGYNPMDCARGPAVGQAAYEATLKELARGERHGALEALLASPSKYLSAGRGSPPVVE